MSEYKSYDNYKDSRIAWVGGVPNHWDLKKSKFIFKEESEKDHPNETLLSVLKGKGLLPRNELAFSTVMAFKDLENFKLVEKNSFVIHLRSFQSGFEMSQVRGVVSPAYSVFKLRKQGVPGYYKYLFYSKPFIEFIASTTLSLRDGKPISYQHFSAMLLPLSSNKEQQAIANFLDHKTSEIDTLIADKEKLIELLKEQRQAIITEAVTKGLNPDVKMKDSGIEWIGEIPEHWGVTKVKYFYDVCLGKMVQPLKQSPDDTFEPYLCSVNVKWEGINVEDIKYMWLSLKDKVKYAIQPGDLIVNEGGDAGRAGIWAGQISECYIQNAVHRVRGKKGNLNKYLYYWLFTLKNVGHIDLICNKATIMHFTAEKFKNLLIIMPPKDEQCEIVKYVDNKIQTVYSIINELQLEIQKLKEYRQSLIYEAVTGKIDVRDWADKPLERSDAVANA